VNPIIVHGGGKDITRAMEDAGIPVEFKDGQRVTTDEGMEIVRTVLAGKVNQELVRALNEHGNIAVGVSGIDGGTIIAEPASPELGRVGKIKRINGQLLQDLVDADYIPVIASVAIGNDGGYCNVNADVVAGQIAAATGAAKILFLTDVDGLYLDFDDKDTLVSQLSLSEARELVDGGTLSSGMIPKLRSCVGALEGGVPSAYIVNGTISHAILLEMLTLTGVGTAVYTDSDDASAQAAVGNFASKLLENK
jgi:acetylglutamate kinase